MMETNEVKTCLGKTPFPFMKLRWFFIFFSFVAVALSFYGVWFKGLNLGVDFLGGSKLVYQFDQSITSDLIRAETEKLGVGDVQIVPFGSDLKLNQYILRAKEVTGQDVPSLIKNQFKQAFGEDKISVLSEEVVGARVGEDLARKGFLSIAVACALILLYIGIRFDFLFAPGAIVALIHDVIISVGFFPYLGKEFNLPILAALLTIIGYSINDTIIIYDRIRENLTKYRQRYALKDIIDISLTETFRRTLVTSLTVFIVVLVLFYLGGGVLHDFAFCMMIGVIFGTYSSLFIASPIYIFLQKLFPNRGMVALAKNEEQKTQSAA